MPCARALLAPGEAARIIAVVTRERLAVPGWELEEQRRKVSWSHRPEERGTELGAWRRAVARISGTVADDGP